jgi:hypothetical protein
MFLPYSLLSSCQSEFSQMCFVNRGLSFFLQMCHSLSFTCGIDVVYVTHSYTYGYIGCSGMHYGNWCHIMVGQGLKSKPHCLPSVKWK